MCNFESGLCLVYEQSKGISSSPVCVLCTNRRRVQLRAGLSCARTVQGYHFETGLFLVYKHRMCITPSPACS
jgi:hypothetical protein